MHVDRLKNGAASTHTIRELRALRALRKEYPHWPYLFVTERKDLLNADDRCASSVRAPTSSQSSPSRSIRTCCAIRPERRAVPHEAGTS